MIQCKRFKRIHDIRDKVEDDINEWLAENPDIKILNTLTSLTDEIFVFFEKISEIEKLNSQTKKLNDLLLNLFHYACPSRYDHTTKKYYYKYYDEEIELEEAKDYLIEKKLIQKEQCE
jgi:hypothetical protein